MLFYHHFLASSGDYNSFYALKNERTVSLKREIEDMQTVLDSYWQRTAPAMHLATTVPGAIEQHDVLAEMGVPVNGWSPKRVGIRAVPIDFGRKNG